MGFSLLYLVLLFLPPWVAGPALGDFTPPFSYLLNCGASSNTSIGTRTWIPDAPFVSSSSSISATPGSSLTLSSDDTPLLQTARIFPSAASYSFSVSASSRYWIRLYLYPFAYESYNLKSSLFSVSADGFTLLSKTNVAAAIISSSSSYLFKEYSVNATSNTLTISFMPIEGSTAFINAIEVTSMPSDIILDDSSPLGVNTPKPLGMDSTALECMYRVNVGGPIITPAGDSTGLYRTWLPNNSFLYTSAGITNVSTDPRSVLYSPTPDYFAPRSVYSTAIQMANSQVADNLFNISWVFPMDAEFIYVVRLHFCEIFYTSAGQRVFNVYLQNQTAYPSLDLVYSQGADKVYYRDFTISTIGGIDTLWIQIGPTPNAGVTLNNAILNGIEVWKLNNSVGSMDGEFVAAPENSSSHSSAKVGAIVGGMVGGAFVVGLAFIAGLLLCRTKAKVYKHSPSSWFLLPISSGSSATSIGSKLSSNSRRSAAGSYASSAPSGRGRNFSFVEIQEATSNFDETLVIGVGGFGKVYRGQLYCGTVVAIKRGNPSSDQGITEFKTEIEMLSKLRHRHLVSLIGYCEENSEMILVYEYMAHGPLRSHLYGSDLPPLSWKKRLEICIGAARGLHYLHTGAAQSIIHRDVKTTNILLDENLVAKVADFGLSKTGPTLDHTHVSTAVKGSFGYLDPEYFRRQQLTEKSDVYSFGVVLMEVLCARPALNPALSRDQVNIAEWALHWQNMGMLEQIVDPYLVGGIDKQSLMKYGKIAEKCLAEEGVSRPAMGDVLWHLEYALQLQETADRANLDDETYSKIVTSPVVAVQAVGPHPAQGERDEGVMQSGHGLNNLASEDESQDATASAIFSELINPQGR